VREYVDAGASGDGGSGSTEKKGDFLVHLPNLGEREIGEGKSRGGLKEKTKRGCPPQVKHIDSDLNSSSTRILKCVGR